MMCVECGVNPVDDTGSCFCHPCWHRLSGERLARLDALIDWWREIRAKIEAQ